MMNLDDLKKESPKMPDSIRQMIEKEVADQISAQENTKRSTSGNIDGNKSGNREGNTNGTMHADRNGSINKSIMESRRKKGKMSWKRVAVIAAAATMVLGSTVYAGVQLYRWNIEKKGSYGLQTNVVADTQASETEGTTDTTDTAQAAGTIPTSTAPADIPVLSIQASYLPDGMVAADDGSTKYYFSETPYQGGISVNTVTMDKELTTDAAAHVDTYVTYSEETAIQGQKAVYLEKDMETSGGIGFDKKIYIAYPEYWQILEIFVGEDVSKEETLKIAEGLQVSDTGETRPIEDLATWSDMNRSEEVEDGSKMTATADEMKSTHKIGDAFKVSGSAETTDGEWIMADTIEATVKDVQVADDYSALDSNYVDEDMLAALDDNGKLKDNHIEYIKTGDGVDSLDTVLKSEDVGQKLVYVTVEFKNTGTESLNNILFMGSFVGIQEQNGQYEFYDRASKVEQADNLSSTYGGGFGEMSYYDSHTGERNNNYIAQLQSQESVTIHMAKVVNEDELGKMYLSLDGSGGAYGFSESGLETGYVDIRQ